MRTYLLNLLLGAAAIGYSCSADAQIITSIAGADTTGYNGDNIAATIAQLNIPVGMVTDAGGNIYFADVFNARLRKIDAAGVITTIAGTGVSAYSGDGGPATAAEVVYPWGLAMDDAGNIYFSDLHYNCVRKISTTGIITTVAGTPGTGGYSGDGGPATAATLAQPTGLATDHAGNLYIGDYGNTTLQGTVRKVDVAGTITTIAGGVPFAPGYGDGGPATDAYLNGVSGLALDLAGNMHVMAGVLRKINTAGIISHEAGVLSSVSSLGDGGPATAAWLSGEGIACDNAGNVYIADNNHGRIRKVNPMTGIITTVAGGGIAAGDGGDALYCSIGPLAVCFDHNGDMLVADYHNGHIRKVMTGTTGIAEQTANAGSLDIYPSPCNGNFTLSVASATLQKSNITIMNVAGERVKELIANANTPMEISLDLPSGVYFVVAATAEGKLYNKIVVNR